MYADRGVGESVEETLHARRDPCRDYTPARGSEPRQVEEVFPLGVRDPQCPGQSFDDLCRRRGGAPLFEAGQVVDRDPREKGQLFASQACCSAMGARLHAGRSGVDPVSPAPQGATERPRFHPSSVQVAATLVLALAVLRKPDDCLTAPISPQNGRMTTTLVTGANKGLGKETARLLVEAGHTVYVGARDEARGRAAADELGARFVRLDVTDDSSVASAMATIRADGGLDVLVNNAGIAKRAGAARGEALDGPSALEVFDTNAVGIIRVTEAALPLLRTSENPIVVNVSSALGSFWATHEPSRPASRFPAIVYGSSKAAVSMLTVQYAKAVPEVKFNAVEPGITATELGGGGVESHPGRPAAISAQVVARLACIGPDGPTGTFQEDDGELGW